MDVLWLDYMITDGSGNFRKRISQRYPHHNDLTGTRSHPGLYTIRLQNETCKLIRPFKFQQATSDH